MKVSVELLMRRVLKRAAFRIERKLNITFQMYAFNGVKGVTVFKFYIFGCKLLELNLLTE